MTPVPTLVLPLALLGLASAAPAPEGGRFVVQLGRDTTAVEQYTRTATQLDVQQVGRSPRVLRRHFVWDYEGGTLAHVTLTVTAPGSTTPVQTVEGVAEPDSFRTTVQSGQGAGQKIVVALPKGALVMAGTSPWTAYESAIMRLVRSKADTMSTRMLFLGANFTNVLTLRRIGRDSVATWNDHLDVFHFAIDRDGRILGTLPISGTGKFAATRVPALDLDAMAAAYAAREKTGGGLGVLSPRDTVNVADAGGAALWVDYGRPAMRGRTIFGGIVPWGEVWRTGANAATQFRTDKPLDFGGTVVPPGMYTLWTVPKPDGWTLSFNTQTGQWGTEHDPKRDAYNVPLQVESLPDPEEQFTIRVVPDPDGGRLQLDWASTRASAAFRVVRPK